MAQRSFKMRDGFKIMELASDNNNTYIDVWYDEVGAPYKDTIRMDVFGVRDNLESIYAGYSKIANVLVIREP